MWKVVWKGKKMCEDSLYFFDPESRVWLLSVWNYSWIMHHATKKKIKKIDAKSGTILYSAYS